MTGYTRCEELGENDIDRSSEIEKAMKNHSNTKGKHASVLTAAAGAFAISNSLIPGGVGESDGSPLRSAPDRREGSVLIRGENRVHLKHSGKKYQ